MYMIRFCLTRPQMIEYHNLGPNFNISLPPEKYRISAANLSMFVDDSIPVEEAEKILLLYAYEYFQEDSPNIVIAKKIDDELARRNIPHDPLNEQEVSDVQQALIRARSSSRILDTAAPNVTRFSMQPSISKEDLQKRIDVLTAYLARVESGNPENAARLAPLLYQQIQELHQQLLNLEASGG